MPGHPHKQTFSIIPGRETLAKSQVLKRSWPFFLDLCVAVIGLAVFYAIVRIGMLWAGPPAEQTVISLSPRALPLYAFYSIVRIFLAYILSLFFAGQLRISSRLQQQARRGVPDRSAGHHAV